MDREDIEYGELPLQVLSGHGHVVVYDSNGAEVVPFTKSDWESEVLLNVPNMATVLKSTYEEPVSLLKTNQSWMETQYEDRSMWADGDDGPDWFEPESLPLVPSDFTEKDVIGTPPLRVIVDDDAPGPTSPDDYPDHEIRILDAADRVIYQMHAEEYRNGVEPVTELIEAIRLAYEEPLELLRQQE